MIGLPGAAVEGYEAVDAPYTGEYWGGVLQRNSGGEALLDGSTNGRWWYAVGSRSVYEGGFPGPEIAVNQTELYVHTPCASLSPPPRSSPPNPPPRSPPLSPPPAWPPLPATANELRISGRHTAISFNTNVDGVEPFRCTGVSDRRLTCSGELLAADFRTASGISLEELAQFAGMVPPSAPPPSTPPPEPPTMPAPPTYFLPRTWSLEGGSTGGAVNWVSAQGDILLHFRVDTIESRGSEALVMNSRAGGAWQREERTNYAAAKLPNGRFAFTVRVDASGFHVSTRGGQELWLFRHRSQTPWSSFSHMDGGGISGNDSSLKYGVTTN